MIGLFPHATYTSVELPIKPGDRAILYTDGIPEATDIAGEQFGEERLRQFMGTSKEITSDQFADRFLADLSKWSGKPPDAEQEDDITLVAVRWT
jgi:sigma-B regulation protein RsbU (phosphoserine phosphatase)